MSVINASDLPHGHLKGIEHDASISVIVDHSSPGEGSRLHKHPYDETWVVVDGYLTFQSGSDEFEAGPGDIVIVPSDAPHKFTNIGTEPVYLVCIHASASFDTEWLE